ncbi:uncharacterized protein LACBIDRAFT_333523 [Laccaria bicolor S238N-H82]|uniref:Predicted protein n=1 Tax=Laccaria bicolor (strain S238N-H82 / ATCC MYA-4686) TaxID=486041 RepID=B0DW68_LACBS|nr:uncharacterized protein LACBIDRAFT_333523 [Laccaria bicolor S238N-H82]EDR01131.1 predicted protein [Laccaria bicolor S238N-H82]|eukprot:XP_001888173.1 predicted protein [Laccaria bicolor S238N-H82]
MDILRSPSSNSIWWTAYERENEIPRCPPRYFGASVGGFVVWEADLSSGLGEVRMKYATNLGPPKTLAQTLFDMMRALIEREVDKLSNPELNWRDVEDEVDHWRTVAQSEYCEPYFVSLCYSTALETPIEFYVGLSPLSLLTLEKMEERHRQHYILSVEGSFGVQDGPVLQERIPPFRGRILTTYGTFPYHSVVPLPEENHLSIGYLSSDGVTLNSEDKVFIFVGHNSSEFQIQRFHRYVEHMLRGRAYIGSIHADGNRIMQGQEIIPGAPTLPYLKYDLDDIRIFGKAQLLTLPEYQRLKQSPTHLRLTEHVHLDHLPIPAFDPNFNNGQNLGRLLSTGGKGGQASACQIKILLDYAPGTAKQLDDLDIFIQSLVLTRIPLNYTPATHAGTSHTLSTEMHAAFKSIWEEGKRLYPPKYPLEDYFVGNLLAERETRPLPVTRTDIKPQWNHHWSKVLAQYGPNPLLNPSHTSIPIRLRLSDSSETHLKSEHFPIFPVQNILARYASYLLHPAEPNDLIRIPIHPWSLDPVYIPHMGVDRLCDSDDLRDGADTLRVRRMTLMSNFLWQLLLKMNIADEEATIARFGGVNIPAYADYKFPNSVRKLEHFLNLGSFCWTCSQRRRRGKKMSERIGCLDVGLSTVYCSKYDGLASPFSALDSQKEITDLLILKRECQENDWTSGDPIPHKIICGRPEEFFKKHDVNALLPPPVSGFTHTPGLEYVIGLMKEYPEWDYIFRSLNRNVTATWGGPERKPSLPLQKHRADFLVYRRRGWSYYHDISFY